MAGEAWTGKLTYLPSASSGDVEKAVTELIIDFDPSAEEEGPYEALYNAVSCHSLDSSASGRSSDRESTSKEAEVVGIRTAGVRPVRGWGPEATLAAAAVGGGTVALNAWPCWRDWVPSLSLPRGALPCPSLNQNDKTIYRSPEAGL